MNATAKHFSPRASLAALGLRLRRLRLLAALAGRPPPVGHNCVLLFNQLVC